MITASCACGARVEIRYNYHGTEAARFQEWLAAHRGHGDESNGSREIVAFAEAMASTHSEPKK